VKSRSRILYLIVALAALVVLPLYAYKVYLKTDYTDFFVYYRAASRMKDEMWGMIYTLTDGASPFRYPPFLLPLLRPFAALSLRSASLVWYVLQYVWFGLGFSYLYRTARIIRPERAGIATGLSVLFILRFCLDTFTIGQVSSLMFLGYCFSLYAYVRGDFFASGSGMFLPTLFKVGPGFTYLLFPFSKLEQWIRAWLAPFLWMALLSLVTIVSVGGWRTFSLLFGRWIAIVQADDSYYDASHYGSQALKSVLMRVAQSFHWPIAWALTTWLIISAIGCVAIFLIWAGRRAQTAEGRGYLFALGIFPYLWFMPETFKYTLTMLALPVLLLFLARDRSKLTWVALGFGILTLSAAAKDFLPDSIFFGIQRASLPFLATLLLGAATVRELWINTVPKSHVPPKLPRPWEQLPNEVRGEGVSVIIPLAGSFPSRASLTVISELQDALKLRFGSQWEIIWVTSAQTRDVSHAARLSELVERFPQSKLVLSSEAGRGFCLREGFLASSGRYVYLYRIEQPVGVRFFSEAMDRLKSGFQLVRANRRDAETRFLIPVKHLRVAYRRHRLGMIFNQVVRKFLPIVASSDTHSGHVLLTRAAASQIFSLQTTGDFLFDLELCVIAKAHALRECELPVELYLFEEKSGERILSEIVSILSGLPTLRSRYRRGCYEPLRELDAITADDWGMSRAVNEAILDLARQGVVRRVSVMANTRYVQDRLDELRAVPGIQLGIHFNLTYGMSLSNTKLNPSPKNILLSWLNPFTGKSELRAQVRAELTAQLKKLREVGIDVRYFDGHHHIHLVPGILDALAETLKAAGIQVVRLPNDPSLKFSSKFALVPLSWLARTTIRKHQFASLPLFYPLAAHFQDHGLMRSKINRNPTAEVIVHPASYNDIHELEFTDTYTEGRVNEFRALRMLGYIIRMEREEQPS